jgi:hypothetical protein
MEIDWALSQLVGMTDWQYASRIWRNKLVQLKIRKLGKDKPT